MLQVVRDSGGRVRVRMRGEREFVLITDRGKLRGNEMGHNIDTPLCVFDI